MKNGCKTAGGQKIDNYITIPDFCKFWMMWDLSNGHKGYRGYIWIFRTKKEAMDHRRKQHKSKTGARLSIPIKMDINPKLTIK